MNVGIGNLRGTSSQVVETTLGFVFSGEELQNDRAFDGVTKNGSTREKKTRQLFEAICMGVALFSLFLMGCSGSMIAQPRPTSSAPVVELSGEANIPASPEEDLDSLAAAAALENEKQTLALRGFAQQDAVLERVRLVTGWLRFTSQNKTAERIETGWARLSAGEIFGTLNSTEVPERPELSRRELMLWRQMVLESAAEAGADLASAIDQTQDRGSAARLEAAKRREALAILLTVAKTPDDLMGADDLLFAPETFARR